MADFIFSEQLGDLSRQATQRRQLNAELFNRALQSNRIAAEQARQQENRRLNTVIGLAELAAANRQRQQALDAETQRRAQYVDFSREQEANVNRRHEQELAMRRAIAEASQQQEAQQRGQSRSDAMLRLGINLAEEGTRPEVIASSLGLPQSGRQAIEGLWQAKSQGESRANALRQMLADQINSRGAKIASVATQLEDLASDDTLSNKELNLRIAELFKPEVGPDGKLVVGIPFDPLLATVSRGNKTPLMQTASNLRQGFIDAFKKNADTYGVVLDPDTLSATPIMSGMYATPEGVPEEPVAPEAPPPMAPTGARGGGQVQSMAAQVEQLMEQGMDEDTAIQTILRGGR